MIIGYYCCPECGNSWEEESDCACDSECGECGLTEIEAHSHQEVDEEPWDDNALWALLDNSTVPTN